MKSPLCGYYGGKGRLAPLIASLIDMQGCNSYIEPFCGGASVYFALNKGRAGRNYTINDFNRKIANFYTVIKTQCDDLLRLIDNRMVFSKQWHADAQEVWNADIADEVEHAWSLWYSINTSFSSMVGGTFSRTPDVMHRQKVRLIRGRRRVVAAKDIIDMAAVRCEDANELILSVDSADCIIYVDPPYVDANQSHYGGYMQADFDNLLDILGKMKGKFILSHYQNKRLSEYIDKYGWHLRKISTRTSIHCGSHNEREEWLVHNFVDGLRLA